MGKVKKKNKNTPPVNREALQEKCRPRIKSEIDTTAKTLLNKIQNITNTKWQPIVGLILGTSGPNEFLKSKDYKTIAEFKYSDFGFNLPSANGHKGVIVAGEYKGIPHIAFFGRSHFFENNDQWKTVLPARVLIYMGIKTFIITNASGLLTPHIKPGDIALIKDHINEIPGPLLAYYDDMHKNFTQYTDMSDAYSSELRRKIKKKYPLMPEVIYTAVTGPQFETRAEVIKHERNGGEVIGMSTTPEVCALKQYGARVVAFTCPTNYCTGVITKNKVTHEENLSIVEAVNKKFSQIILDTIEIIAPKKKI